MNSGNRKSCTCSELIHVLGRDLYYGVRLIRADTGEPYVIDPNSSGYFRTKQKPDKQSDDNAQDPPYHPAQITIYDTDSLVTLYYTGSEETKSILDAIYQGMANRHNFKVRFRRLPCKTELLRHLVYSWCGLLGLRYSRNGQLLDNPEFDILDNWSKDFEIKLEDLKVFLRKNSWPLPVKCFEDEPDNTERKIDLSDKEFQKAYLLQIELAPKLQQQLEELKNIQPGSLDEQELKLKEITKLENQIKAIMNSEIALNGETTPTSKQLERISQTMSRHNDWNRQYRKIKQQNPDKSGVWISEKIAREQTGKKYDAKTIRRRMKNPKS